MESYKFRIVSISRILLIYFFCLFLVSLCIYILNVLNYNLGKNIYFITIISFVSLLLFTFSKSWTSKFCEIILDNNNILIKYENILNKSQEYKFKIKNIKKYNFQQDSYFQVFKIYCDNLSFKIHISNSDLESEKIFLSFYSSFEKKIEKINEIENLSISKRVTFYKSKLGLVSAIIIAICMVLIPVLHVINKKELNLGLIISFCSMGLFFIYKVYLERKKG